jgi:Tfp pilus assembly protein PilV
MTGRHQASAHRPRRAGLSLLEVVIAMAILLFSIVAITQLVSMGSQRALDVQQQAIGTMLCQRKLAEIAMGAESLNSSGYAPFPEDGMDDWQWKVDADQGAVNGLWSVQVTVKYQHEEGETVEIQLGQMILDPTLRGSNQDPPPSQSTTSNSSNSAAQSSTTSSTTTPSSSTPAASAPAAAAPATTAPKTTTTPSTNTNKTSNKGS